MSRILVLFAHPALEKSRVNIRLAQAAKSVNSLTFCDLYESYPDFFIDVATEQQLLTQHDIIVWHHPMYWYSCPPLLKQWIDLVLTHGWAYGSGGRALEGKYVLNAITTGGGEMAYHPNGFNRFPLRQFLIPFEQTVRLCRMSYLPPFVVQGTHRMNNVEIEAQAERYATLLRDLRDDKFDLDAVGRVELFNQLL
ncbi:MAG: NAD(P)H-dependent oxidoreductase [Saprospiraceae bacterium]|nr:NAD(P)H-dependent oxidoreductase [Saprospiraceae bacterium]